MKKLITSYRKQKIWWPLCVGVAALLAGVFLIVALGTYYDHDTSWFFTTTDHAPVHNKAGFVGAQLSALLIYLFGVAAVLIIPFLFFIAYIALRYYDFAFHADALVAACCGVAVVAALADLYSCTPFVHNLPGGIIGAALRNGVVYLFDAPIANLFLWLMLFASMVIVTHVALLYYSYQLVRMLFSRPVVNAIMHAARLCAYACYYVAKKTCGVFQKIYKKVYGSETVFSCAAPDFEETVRAEYHNVMNASVFSKRTSLPDEPLEQTVSQNYQCVSSGATESVSEQQDELVRQKEDVSAYRLPQPPAPTERKQTASDRAAQLEDEERAETLEEKLRRFGIAGKVVSIKKGPVVTLFEYQPDIDTKISKILALEDDLALALQAMSIRIIAPIPGRSVVGFEVANKHRSQVSIAALIQSSAFNKSDARLPLVLGVDTVGEPVIVDLMSMPHLLVAGATGSGKSVGLNTMLVSLLYKLTPSDMRLILIDPKRLEFASYADIAHLLFPIVTQMKDVVSILRWLVQTMEQRYTIMAACGVRHVLDYQKKSHHDTTLEPMPFIVVMIDEFSDLMMTTGREVEDLIVRIAQMARAAGIHMIIATQRPSVDVITGLIKVNFPSRVAFRVTSKVDSRTILDVGGAEKLLGKGDMLFLHAQAHIARVHGAYISDNEIHELVSYIQKEQVPQYLDLQKVAPQGGEGVQDEDTQLFKEVCDYLETVDEISISLLQRKFRIGYNRSARIMEQLEMHGLILSSDGSKMRKVVHSR